jgi:hypothetical protein
MNKPNPVGAILTCAAIVLTFEAFWNREKSLLARLLGQLGE